MRSPRASSRGVLLERASATLILHTPSQCLPFLTAPAAPMSQLWLLLAALAVVQHVSAQPGCTIKTVEAQLPPLEPVQPPTPPSNRTAGQLGGARRLQQANDMPLWAAATAEVSQRTVSREAALEVELKVGDTLALKPPSNWNDSSAAGPSIFWLQKGDCPSGNMTLKHNPKRGMVQLAAEVVSKPEQRLELTYDAPGTFFYSTSFASSCESGLVKVKVIARGLDCAAPPRPAGCNLNGRNAANEETDECFCVGLVGYFPNLSTDCSWVHVCTGVRGTNTFMGCAPGKKFSSLAESCVPPKRARCGPNSSNYVAAGFLGAYPDGQPPPALSAVPVSRPFYYILSFAREDEGNRDGNFKPVWDIWGPNLQPNVILASKQANPNLRFLMSLAGWGHEFRCPANRGQWVANAANSLLGLMGQYNLDGVDINYEGCPLTTVDCDQFTPEILQCFVDTMVALMQTMRSINPSTIFTLSPYAATWPPYRALTQASRAYVATLLYQNYAWPFPSDTTFQINHMMKIAKEAGGFRRLTYGVCTTQPAWRGLQAPYVYDVYRGLRANGVAGFFTWSLEDSAKNNPPFGVEATLQQML